MFAVVFDHPSLQPSQDSPLDVLAYQLYASLQLASSGRSGYGKLQNLVVSASFLSLLSASPAANSHTMEVG